jgi:hypothetical protein
MVYIETYYGLLGAHARFHLLEKNDGEWTESKLRFSSCERFS